MTARRGHRSPVFARLGSRRPRGAEPGSVECDEAESEGLRVVSPYEACEEADLLVLSVVSSDDRVVADVVVPNLVPGCLIVLGGDAEPWGRHTRRCGRRFASCRGVAVSSSGRSSRRGAVRRCSRPSWWRRRGSHGSRPSRSRGRRRGTRAGVLRTADSEYLLAHQTAGAFYRGRGLTGAAAHGLRGARACRMSERGRLRGDRAGAAGVRRQRRGRARSTASCWVARVTRPARMIGPATGSERRWAGCDPDNEAGRRAQLAWAARSCAG